MNIFILILLILVLVLQVVIGIFLVRFQQSVNEFSSDLVKLLKYFSDLSLGIKQDKSGTWDEKYEVQEEHRNRMIRREIGSGLQDIPKK